MALATTITLYEIVFIQSCTVKKWTTMQPVNIIYKNDVNSEKLVHCIFILWVNTQNLTG